VDDFNAFGMQVIEHYRRQSGTSAGNPGGHDHRAFVESQMRSL